MREAQSANTSREGSDVISTEEIYVMRSHSSDSKV